MEMHLYAQGGHAFGLRRTKFPITGWPQLVETGLATIGIAYDNGIVGNESLSVHRQALGKTTAAKFLISRSVVVLARHKPSAHRTQPTLNDPVPDADMGRLQNEHLGGSWTKRPVKCNKLQTRHGCECQKIGIRPHFR